MSTMRASLRRWAICRAMSVMCCSCRASATRSSASGCHSSRSASKLSTFRDGIRILGTIVILFKEEKPLAFFAAVAAVLAAVSIGLAVPVIIEFMNTGLVPRQPTALLATGVMLSALLSLVCGVILESVKRGQREIKRLFYLQTPER